MLSFVLSLAFRPIAIPDGMNGAHMITSQTLGTMVSPTRASRFYLYIMYGAFLLASLARNTSIRNTKRFGRHQEAIEERTDDIGLQERNGSFVAIEGSHPHLLR